MGGMERRSRGCQLGWGKTGPSSGERVRCGAQYHSHPARKSDLLWAFCVVVLLKRFPSFVISRSVNSNETRANWIVVPKSSYSRDEESPPVPVQMVSLR